MVQDGPRFFLQRQFWLPDFQHSEGCNRNPGGLERRVSTEQMPEGPTEVLLKPNGFTEPEMDDELPSGNQTWQWDIAIKDCRHLYKWEHSPYKWGIFQQTMFDYQRVVFLLRFARIQGWCKSKTKHFAKKMLVGVLKWSPPQHSLNMFESIYGSFCGALCFGCVIHLQGPTWWFDSWLAGTPRPHQTGTWGSSNHRWPQFCSIF